MFINRRRTPHDEQFFFDRFGRFMVSWCNILDGIVGVLSGGMLYGGFAYQMMWRVLKHRGKREG